MPSIQPHTMQTEKKKKNKTRRTISYSTNFSDSNHPPT